MKKRYRNIVYIATTAVFLAILSLPLINQFTCMIPVEKPVAAWENRNPVKEPIFYIESADPYPDEFEAFYNDNFIFRQFCLNIYIYIKANILSQSPFSDKVLIGKNNWFYEGGAERESYEGKNGADQDTLQMIISELHCRTKVLKEKNIEFYVAIAPTKYWIHPEHLPVYIHQGNGLYPKLDEILKADTTINYIDLKSCLLENKKDIPLYKNTDNHWNELGGFFVCRSMMDEMQKQFPGLPKLSSDRYSVNISEKEGGNMLDMSGMRHAAPMLNVKMDPLFPVSFKQGTKANYKAPPYFPYADQYEKVYINSRNDLPKLLVIRDSFGDALMPFLSEGFSRVVYIWDAWQYKLDLNIIEKEKPNAVLLIIFEPNLKRFAKHRNCQ